MILRLTTVLAKRLGMTLFLLLFMLSDLGSIALSKDSEKLPIQKAAEERVLRIIHGYDPDALVFVDVISKTQDGEKLPSTPFVVDKLALPDASGSTDIDSLEVMVVSKKPKLPKKVDALIREALKPFSEKVELKVKTLPSELIPDSLSDKEKAEEEAKKEQAKKQEEQAKKAAEGKNPLAGTEKMISEVRDAINALGKSTDSAASVLKAAADAAFSEKSKKIVALIMGATGLYLLILLVISAIFSASRTKKVTSSLSASIKEGVEKMASVMQEAGGGGGKDSEEGSSQIGGILDGTLAQEDGHGGVSAMSDRSILAILCDCYWAKEDGYAALLWRKIPMGRRSLLIESEAFLRDFIAFLGSAPDLVIQDLHAEHDPYYLTPLPINHLDNDALAAAAKSSPGLFSLLPPLRTSAMSFSTSERLGFLAESEGVGALPPQEEQEKRLKELASSSYRPLYKLVIINMTSLEEEAEVLAQSANFSLEKKRCLRTLGWLAELPKEKGAAILKNYSAKQLASVWIAPTSVLEKLATFIPEEKLQLVSSYKEKIPASRDSALYRSLHEASIRALGQLQASDRSAAPVKQQREEAEAAPTGESSKSGETTGGESALPRDDEPPVF